MVLGKSLHISEAQVLTGSGPGAASTSPFVKDRASCSASLYSTSACPLSLEQLLPSNRGWETGRGLHNPGIWANILPISHIPGMGLGDPKVAL